MNADTCKWIEGVYYDSYETGEWNAKCGLDWYLEQGTPSEHGMIFCPKCGRKIQEVTQWNDSTSTNHR